LLARIYISVKNDIALITGLYTRLYVINTDSYK